MNVALYCERVYVVMLIDARGVGGGIYAGQPVPVTVEGARAA
jgi:hypothetical protein